VNKSAIKRISLVLTDSTQNMITLRRVKKGELIHLFDLGSVETSQPRMALNFTCSSSPKIRTNGEDSSTMEVPDIYSLRSGIVKDLCETVKREHFSTLVNLSVHDLSKFALFRGFTDDQLKFIGPLLNLVRLPPRAIVSVAGCISSSEDPVLAIPLLGSFVKYPDPSSVKAGVSGYSITRDEILTVTTLSDVDDGSKKAANTLTRSKTFSRNG
jgi:hypothetical protein